MSPLFNKILFYFFTFTFFVYPVYSQTPTNTKPAKASSTKIITVDEIKRLPVEARLKLLEEYKKLPLEQQLFWIEQISKTPGDKKYLTDEIMSLSVYKAPNASSTSNESIDNNSNRNIFVVIILMLIIISIFSIKKFSYIQSIIKKD